MDPSCFRMLERMSQDDQLTNYWLASERYMPNVDFVLLLTIFYQELWCCD